jgi:hypothetical protein
MHCRWTCFSLLLATAVATTASQGRAETPSKPLRAGIIGLDTSHVIAFTSLLNSPKAAGDLAGVKVVAAFPGGTEDNPASWNRVKGYTEQIGKLGVEIVPSIDELLKKVDVVLLESVDGRPHLEQARPVIAAGKPLFIDKPMAASLVDVIEIFRLAKERNVPCFSSSSLRFGAATQAVRSKAAPYGEVKNCTTWGPMSTEPHHPDLFWYGIHGVEMLYAIMGPGCKTVVREGPEKVTGVWADGRKGTFEARKNYGAQFEGTKQSGQIDKYEGYQPLVVEICKFFKTGKPPVTAEETIELFAFMEGADESKRQGGAAVTIESVMEKARKAAKK